MRKRTLGPLAAAALACAAAAAAPTAASAAVTCDKVASLAGSDANAGTLAAPYKTVSKLVDNLAAGQTGCIRAGTYAEPDIQMENGGTSTSRIVIRNYPGETPQLDGRLFLRETADNVTVQGLRLTALTVPSANAGDTPSVLVYSSNVTFRFNDVSGADNRICFGVGRTPVAQEDNTPPLLRSADVVIDRNRIHNCGNDEVHDHGIYLEATDDAVVTRNWIYDNSGRGVQLYPDAQGTQILENVMDDNDINVQFSGEQNAGGSVSSSNNLASNNVLSNPDTYNVRGYWGGGAAPGTGNVVSNSCLFSPAHPGQTGIPSWDVGFTVDTASNTIADPVYVNRAAKDFRLPSGNGCRAKLGAAASDAIPGPDVTAPAVTITSGPSGTVTSPNATFAFTSEPGTTFTCKLDAGAQGACTSPKSYTGLANGSHTFTVEATDAAGNSATASRTWTVAQPYGDAVLATSGLRAFWRLGETTGTTAADALGTSPGTYANGALLNQAALPAGTFNAGNKAAAFDGVNDQVYVNDTASLDVTSGLTIEGWIKPDVLPAAGTLRTILTKSSSAYDLSLYDSNGRAVFGVTTSAGRATLTVPASTFAAGTRYHVAATYDGTTMRIYRNGVQVASRTHSGAVVATATDLTIGASYGSEAFDGVLDEIALYGSALSGTTVLDHYQRGA